MHDFIYDFTQKVHPCWICTSNADPLKPTDQSLSQYANKSLWYCLSAFSAATADSSSIQVCARGLRPAAQSTTLLFSAYNQDNALIFASQKRLQLPGNVHIERQLTSTVGSHLLSAKHLLHMCLSNIVHVCGEIYGFKSNFLKQPIRTIKKWHE